MGVVPAKIIFMIILSSEVALVSSPNRIIITKKSKQTSVIATGFMETDPNRTLEVTR